MDIGIENPVLLRVENLTKTFANVVANHDISLDVRKGEIHCLLGENGAGKTTLAECLYGAYQPDHGHLYFKGQQVHLASPKDAIQLGIGMVHQHFVLAQPMTAIENIVVGTRSSGIALNLDQACARLQTLCQNYSIQLPLQIPVSQLSVGEQQWVEILKALYVGVDLLILDEPTAVLTPKEIEQFFTILNKMKRDGLSIILITHKLKEVIQISDRVTVMRKGKQITTVDTAGVTVEELASLMVGREVIFQVKKGKMKPGEPVLQVERLQTLNDQNCPALDGVDLCVRQGEIVGLAGVAGNGQKELFDVIVGVRKATAGKISLGQQEITNLSPKKIIERGLASIPPDRIKEGLIMDFTLDENLILGRHRSEAYCRGGLFNFDHIKQFAQQSIQAYEIAATSSNQKTRQLSGGNLQKLILAREISLAPRCLIASSPTRGLDVGATEYIHQQLVQLRDAGSGILLISEDLDEIFNVSDTIAVIFKGKIMGVFPAHEVNIGKIGLLMAGIQDEAK